MTSPNLSNNPVNLLIPASKPPVSKPEKTSPKDTLSLTHENAVESPSPIHENIGLSTDETFEKALDIHFPNEDIVSLKLPKLVDVRSMALNIPENVFENTEAIDDSISEIELKSNDLSQEVKISPTEANVSSNESAKLLNPFDCDNS